MSMRIGWLKLYRELLDKPIWKNSSAEHKSILITLLLMANHEENKWEWQNIPFSVKPGQFITSLENIALEAGIGVSVQNVRSGIKRFESLSFLTNQSTNSGRLITILNWDSYQSKEFKPTKHPTSNQQAPNKQPTTIKEVKKLRSKELEYPDWLDLKLWSDFKDFRKEINKPLKFQGESRALNKLKKLVKDGNKYEDVINQSIERGWTGLFEVKNKSLKGSVQSRPTQKADMHILGDGVRILKTQTEAEFLQFCKTNHISPSDMDIIRKRGG